MKTTIEKHEGGVRYIFTRENWKEWFRYFRVIYSVEEGGQYPKFYLPVVRDYHRVGYTCWIMPLAPFVLVVVALTRALRQFWFYLVDVIDKWNPHP